MDSFVKKELENGKKPYDTKKKLLHNPAAGMEIVPSQIQSDLNFTPYSAP